MLGGRVCAFLKAARCARLALGWNLWQARYICTGTSAFTSPMHYLDGERIEPTNTDAGGHFPILEPATG